MDRRESVYVKVTIRVKGARDARCPVLKWWDNAFRHVSTCVKIQDAGVTCLIPGCPRPAGPIISSLVPLAQFTRFGTLSMDIGGGHR